MRPLFTVSVVVGATWMEPVTPAKATSVTSSELLPTVFRMPAAVRVRRFETAPLSEIPVPFSLMALTVRFPVVAAEAVRFIVSVVNAVFRLFELL